MSVTSPTSPPRRLPLLTESEQRRLWAKIALPDENGCMLWTASITTFGYGQLSLRRNAGQLLRTAHQLVYSTLVGDCPVGFELDHRCGVRRCVAPDHLRPVTRKQNMENLGGPYRTSVSGIRGVSWSEPHRKWCARVQHNGRSLYLGLFADPAEAGRVAAAKRAELFTHNDRERSAS